MGAKNCEGGRISKPSQGGNAKKSEHTVFPTPLCLLIVGCFTVHKVVFNAMLVK